ncbi:DUF92 domain-containing protein [Occallatibacter savannae]|uniref:DUF92 domain-containing protein n=1 Tax=Occallatibacter savannae TaxID=1002691 RepID=UPI000D688366|nr:DUF92 domain-containing protein [Occallatibacter savannae]
MARRKLQWQSKTVLLLVFPAIGADVVLESRWWLTHSPSVAIWTLGLSVLLGLVAYKVRSAKAGAALAGMAITASMMYGTVESFPFLPWKTALVPILTVLLLTSLATRAGHQHKERLGTAESRTGREASQVAANLGIAALISNPLVQIWLIDHGWIHASGILSNAAPALALGLAALAEAAADTVSSELGQILSGHPRMITTFRKAEPGTDGAISLGGTAMGIIAAAAVAAAGSWAIGGGTPVFMISWAGGVFGLFFDSLLGATLERAGWLNNDAVNFLSTASGAAFALALLAVR